MRFHLFALIVAPAIMILPASAMAQEPSSESMEKLADELSDCPPAEDAGVRPDGKPNTTVCARQWLKGKVVQQNINMSFALGSAELTAAARAALDRFASGLVRIRTFRPFTVEGHTDRSGSRELNMALSGARANAVVDYLASKGVDRSRMTARGFGYDRTLPGLSATDAANRRVEVSAR